MRLLRHTTKIYLKVFLKAIKWHSHNTKACSHFGFSSCRGSLYVSQWEQTYTLLLTQWSRCDSKAPQRRKQTENRGPKGSGGGKAMNHAIVAYILLFSDIYVTSGLSGFSTTSLAQSLFVFSVKFKNSEHMGAGFPLFCPKTFQVTL